jgi:tRNA A-37 threonylcarbamoyl transferase component Bud32
MTGHLEPGALIAGKYRTERILGAGGMGTVVAAQHVKLGTRVAIKLMAHAMLGNAEAAIRFEREAQASARIQSEHVCRVFDVGLLEDGAPYMVMELLEGKDLSTLLQDTGRLPIQQLADFVLQACHAIAEAHGMGIVHRDLKPANLFCAQRPDGRVSIKVLDFGISKFTAASGAEASMGMTQTQTVMGSPYYMSPEQMESSRNVDARSDIWALGAILYELATGDVPFSGTTIPQVCAKILKATPPPIAELRADVPSGFEAIVRKCLQKERESRYASIAELAVDLLPFASPDARLMVSAIVRANRGAEGAGTMAASSTAVGSAAGIADTMSPAGHTVGGRRKRGKAAGIAVAAIGVAVLVGVAALHGLSKEAPATPAAPSSSAASTVAQPSATAPALPAAPPTMPPAAPVPASPPGAAEPEPLPAPASPAASVPPRVKPSTSQPAPPAEPRHRQGPALAATATPAPAPAKTEDLYDDRK